MKKQWVQDIDFLEQGDIYFFYKPSRKADMVTGLKDVARFFVVLEPYERELPRYIVFGGKQLPEARDGGGTAWGFIQMVGGRGFSTKTKIPRPRKQASRPAGEGVYTIISHRDHTHLLYSLEIPKALGEVQRAFNIHMEGNYLLAQRPVSVSPSSAEQPFSNFRPVTLEHLNQRGTELLFIGVGTDVGRLGLKVEGREETLATADIFERLKVNRKLHPETSLVTGKWEE